MTALTLVDSPVTQYKLLATPTACDQNVHWLGHDYSKAENLLDFCFDEVKRVASAAFFTLSTLFSDPIPVNEIFRKLQQHILPYIELRKGIPDYYLKLKNVMRSYNRILDSLQLTTDLDYFVNSKFKKDNLLQIAGRVTLFAARIGLCSLWLVQKKIVSFVADRAFNIASSLFAADALRNVLNARTDVHQQYAIRELVKNTADVAMSMLLLAGMGVTGLCVMSCVCVATQISSTVYKEEHKRELAK